MQQAAQPIQTNADVDKITTTHDPTLTDVISAKKFDLVFERFRPYFRFAVKNEGSKVQLESVRSTLTASEGGRRETPLQLLLTAPVVIPDELLKLILETAPPVADYLSIITDTWANRQHNEWRLPLEAILDCVHEKPLDWTKKSNALNIRCDQCVKPTSRGVIIFHTSGGAGRYSPDTCAAVLKSFEPKSLTRLATEGSWHAIIHRIRNRLVLSSEEGTLEEVSSLKEVYQKAGRVQEYRVQIELGYFYPKIFSPPPQPRRAELELITNAMAQLLLDGREDEKQSLKADFLAENKKLSDRHEAKVDAEIKTLERRIVSLEGAHKESLENTTVLETRMEGAQTAVQVSQSEIRAIVSQITALEIKIEAIRGEFRCGTAQLEKNEEGARCEDSEQRAEQEIRDAQLTRYFHEAISSSQMKLDEQLEKHKSSMIGYIDGKIEGQISLLVTKLAALERDVDRLKQKVASNAKE